MGTRALRRATGMDDRDTSTEESSVKPGFDTVVEEHSDFVYNLALRMMGSPEDAEDVAQDAFISAYRFYGRFRGDSRVTTWLYRITTNAALMRLRKGPRADADGPSATSRWLAGSRAAVVLRDMEWLSNAEADDVLDVTVSSLKSRLHRARVQLRKHLAEFRR